MWSQSAELHQLIVQEQTEDYLRHKVIDRQLREAGVASRGWLSGQACRSLFLLGGLLVNLGRRLEGRFASPAWYRQIAG